MSNTDTTLPTTFDVQALAKQMVLCAAQRVDAKTLDEQQRASFRLAGLVEAWTHMTRSDLQVHDLLEGRGESPSQHVQTVLDEALVIAVDVTSYTATI